MDSPPFYLIIAEFFSDADHFIMKKSTLKVDIVTSLVICVDKYNHDCQVINLHK